MSAAKDQVGRLLALVPLIRRRGEIHVDEAAALLGVAPAQLVSDLRVLIFCGWPGWLPGDLIEVDLDALEPDGDGMIRIANADYLAAPLRLSRAEAAALVVALNALRDSASPEVLPTIESTLGKIESAAGSSAVASVDPRTARRTSQQGELERAVRDRRQVELRYLVLARDEVTERVVDALAVVTADGVDYLDAWCHLAQDRRSFRLDRILDATVLTTAAELHDVPALDLSAGIFRPAPEDPVVTLRVSREARWVADYYPLEGSTEVGGGALEVTLRVADEAWLRRLLLRLTPHVEVLAPSRIAAQYAEAVATTRMHYGPGVG